MATKPVLLRLSVAADQAAARAAAAKEAVRRAKNDLKTARKALKAAKKFAKQARRKLEAAGADAGPRAVLSDKRSPAKNSKPQAVVRSRTVRSQVVRKRAHALKTLAKPKLSPAEVAKTVASRLADAAAARAAHGAAIGAENTDAASQAALAATMV